MNRQNYPPETIDNESITYHNQRMDWINDQISKAQNQKTFAKLMLIRDQWNEDFVKLCNRKGTYK